MDLVDLNKINGEKIIKKYGRDPYGSRGSKLLGMLLINADDLSRSLWISWI